jgi:hypothetical protein
MQTLTRPRAVAVLAAGGTALLAVLATGAAAAQAATPQAAAVTRTAVTADATPTGSAALAAVKKQAAAEIARRQTALSARLAELNGADPALTSSDRAALITLVKNDQSGLSALGAKIAADPELATARADRQQIFTGYRVFALALPQVRLVRASDALTGRAVPLLTDAETRLAAALAKSGETGEAAAKMADLQAQIQAIQDGTSGLSAKLLGFTPAQYNADHTLLSGPRQSLVSARSALRQARADIVAVRAMLRS